MSSPLPQGHQGHQGPKGEDNPPWLFSHAPLPPLVPPGSLLPRQKSVAEAAASAVAEATAEAAAAAAEVAAAAAARGEGTEEDRAEAARAAGAALAAARRAIAPRWGYGVLVSTWPLLEDRDERLGLLAGSGRDEVVAAGVAAAAAAGEAEEAMAVEEAAAAAMAGGMGDRSEEELGRLRQQAILKAVEMAFESFWQELAGLRGEERKVVMAGIRPEVAGRAGLVRGEGAGRVGSGGGGGLWSAR
ncbi:unnamed protein product [Discosporangium mesarthrocarpum]